MRHLSIDIETYSGTDIKSAGAYRYAQDQDFEVMLFAYAWDFGEVRVVDFKQGESLPDDIISALRDPEVVKHAYNAPFEIWCLKQAGYETMASQWRCTMHHGLYLGYPAGLGAIGEALGLESDKQKDRSGAALIRYFCGPCKPTRTNGGRTRNKPHHDPDKWVLFKEYCRQDVVAEMAILQKLQAFPVPETEIELWRNDVEMNSIGVRTDPGLVAGAMEIDQKQKSKLLAEAQALTELANPNSPAQLQGWLADQGADLPNLQKATVAEAIDDDKTPPKAKRALELRQLLSKTSVSKYQAIVDSAGPDDRVRGLFQVYGANRTGRWAGRLVQVQNLPRNYLEPLGLARDLAKRAEGDQLEVLWGPVADTLSQLIRTAFVPSVGRKFIVSDFSAIEARVVAWLAGEDWVNDVFASHGRIYEATASQMFDTPIEKIVRGQPEYELRQKGKVATLALGYQGSVGALKTMGALKMGLTEEELPDIVARWRNANPNIVRFWYDIEAAALGVMQDGNPRRVSRVTLERQADMASGLDFLTIALPSGRSLYYPKPFVSENDFGKQALHFYGINTAKKFDQEGTYGGKLVENIVQATARDCLATALLRLKESYPYDPVVMHIHDEVVLDARPETKLEEVNAILSEPIAWAPDLILKAEGFECDYYQKD